MHKFKEVSPFHFVEGVSLPSNGASGGIWLFWDAAKIEMVDHWVGLFSVSMVGKIKRNATSWVVTGVYGPREDNLLRSFLEELSSIQERWEGCWCIGGDFNEVLEPFVDFIDRKGLRDVSVGGLR